VARLGPERVSVRRVLRAQWLLTPAVLRRTESLYFPPLTDVLQRVREQWLSGPARTLFLTDEVRRIGAESLRKLVPGFLLGAVLGSALGIAIGLLPRFRAVCYPAVHFLRGVPAVAMLPLFIVLLGPGDSSTVWLIAVSVTWPVLINVLAGVDAAEPLMGETLRLYGAGPAQRVRWLTLPSATPPLFAGLRIATMVALAVLTVSEMYSGGTGIGAAALLDQRRFDFVGMWSAVLLLAVLGLALNGALALAEHRALAWHRGARAVHR